MLSFVGRLFDTSDFPARWHCGAWDDGHGWLHILSDVGVWSAYLAIPVVLLVLARRRRGLPFRRLFVLFCAFILFCGTTHLMEAVLFWWPAYRLAGAIKLVTAVVSWMTVVALIRVLPRALALRTPEELSREVAGRRQAEEELRASERRYRLLVGGVRDTAIFLFDESGRVTSWNLGAERIKGYTATEIVGRHFSCFYPDEDVAAGKTDRALRLARESGRYEEEGWRVRKDGSRFWAHVVITPLRDENEQFQGYTKTTRDLTAWRDTERALRESERRFQAIFHSQFQFIGLMTPDGTLLEANRTALAAVGVAEADVIGKAFWDTGWWTHDAAQQERLRAATAAAAAGERVRFEASHPTADGGLMWVDFSLTPFRDDDGRVVLLIPEGRDITARKAVEVRLEQSEVRLRHAAEAAAVGVWEWNLITNQIYWNDQMFQIYQVAPTADGLVSYDTWTDRVLPEDLSRQEKLLRETVERAGSGNRAFRIRHPNGECRHIEAAESVRTNAHGRVEWVVGTNLDVTERRRAEAALRESEERFDLAVCGSQDGIWDWHIQTGAVYFSPRWKGMLGYAEDEVANRFEEWEWLVHPDDRPPVKAALAAYLDGSAAAFGTEVRMREKDGGYRWILTRGVALWDAAGRPYRMAGSHTDVTDRRRAEEALRLSEARFRGLAANAPVGIYQTDAAGKCLFVNARWCRKAGMTPDEAAGHGWVSAIHPDDRDRVAAEWYAAAEAQTEFVSDYRFRTPDGRVTWLSGRAVAIRGEAGEVLGYIGTVMNVTARMEAEAKLRASEERYRSVVEVLAEGIVLQDARGEIIAFNDRAGKILGLSLDKLTGRTSFDLEWRAVLADGSPLPGEEHPAIIALRTGRPVFDVLMGVERPSGERVWLSVNAVPFGDGPRQVVASFHDVTERKLIETQLREANAALQALTQVQTDFLVTASPQKSFDGLLSVLLRMTDSEYGFVGQVLCDPSGQPYLKTRAITDISWNDATRRFYAEGAPSGLAFTNLDTLFGAVLTSGRPVIANRPATDPRRGGLPPGHPPLNAFLGIPFCHGSELIGMVGVANRPGGYDEGLIEALAPVLSTCASLVMAYQLQTERESAETALRASLHEKDVMLREIHHRVKNNLAVIASLFHLQSGYTTDGPILRLLREAQHRVRSMAMVHEHLYNSADLGAVNFAEYTQSLVEQLFRSYRLPNATVRLALDIGPVTLSIDQAVPCGLILNELISNALKHAFPDRGGSLSIALAADGGECVLRVADDGVGLPPDRLEGKPRSLGLRLIRTLARQLNGTVEFRPATPGTEVRLAFPILDKGPGANA